MNVFVVTRASEPAHEHYVTVTATFEEAEKYIRIEFPNAIKEPPYKGMCSFICEPGGNSPAYRMIIRTEAI